MSKIPWGVGVSEGLGLGGVTGEEWSRAYTPSHHEWRTEVQKVTFLVVFPKIINNCKQGTRNRMINGEGCQSSGGGAHSPRQLTVAPGNFQTTVTDTDNWKCNNHDRTAIHQTKLVSNTSAQTGAIEIFDWHWYWQANYLVEKAAKKQKKATPETV